MICLMRKPILCSALLLLSQLAMGQGSSSSDNYIEYILNLLILSLDVLNCL